MKSRNVITRDDEIMLQDGGAASYRETSGRSRKEIHTEVQLQSYGRLPVVDLGKSLDNGC